MPDDRAAWPAGPVTRRFVVDGRVQGVGFRYFVAREAHALGLSGWVRNLVDGKVEVLASGDATSLEAFSGRLWQGPPAARVTGVAVTEAKAEDIQDFRILPTPW